MSKTREKPIRVAHVIGKWVGGGLEAIVLNYYKYLDRSQVQFDFIVDIGSPRIPREEIEQLGGRIIIVPRYEDVFHYIRELARIFREENYTIVHSHINTMSVFPLCAAWISKVPIRIAHSHSTSNKKEKKKDFIKKCLRPLAKNFATDYFCCSELAGRWLFGNRTYNKGNVYLLRNAIDTGNFRFSQKSRVEKRKKIRAEFLRPDVIVNFFKEQHALFIIYFPGRNTRLLHVFCNNAYPEVPGAPALPAD